MVQGRLRQNRAACDDPDQVRAARLGPVLPQRSADRRLPRAQADHRVRRLGGVLPARIESLTRSPSISSAAGVTTFKAGSVGYNMRLDQAVTTHCTRRTRSTSTPCRDSRQDPKITAEDVWKEWTEKALRQKAAAGSGAGAEAVIRYCQPLILRSAILDHQPLRLPKFSYADDHLHIRTMAKWYPNEPKYKQLEDRLVRPGSGIDGDRFWRRRTPRSRWLTDRFEHLRAYETQSRPSNTTICIGGSSWRNGSR